MMEVQSGAVGPAYLQSEEEIDLRRGPWTVEEDLVLMDYIANHGEGRWNSLARCAGLKRTGKSCRLRWLNYLRPDVRRGNITPEEQLLILELHSRWGNRWSKIAQHLPGRTDNEIKNYWRTRVQKHAKQLRCDVDSKQFKDVMRYLWMPRLVERIRAASGKSTAAGYDNPCGSDQNLDGVRLEPSSQGSGCVGSASDSSGAVISSAGTPNTDDNGGGISGEVSEQMGRGWWPETSLPSPGGYAYHHGLALPELGQDSVGDADSFWSMEDIWQYFEN